MWRSFFQAIEASFDTVTSTMGTVQKGLDIGNDYVANQHKSLTRGFAKQAILDASTQHEAIQQKLEANPKLAIIFADLESEWDDPNWKATANSKPLMGTKTPKTKK